MSLISPKANVIQVQSNNNYLKSNYLFTRKKYNKVTFINYAVNN